MNLRARLVKAPRTLPLSSLGGLCVCQPPPLAPCSGGAEAREPPRLDAPHISSRAIDTAQPRGCQRHQRAWRVLLSGHDDGYAAARRVTPCRTNRRQSLRRRGGGGETGRLGGGRVLRDRAPERSMPDAECLLLVPIARCRPRPAATRLPVQAIASGCAAAPSGVVADWCMNCRLV